MNAHTQKQLRTLCLKQDGWEEHGHRTDMASIWLICTAGFITSSINYRVEERTGENPIHIYLQPKPFSSEKWKKKKKNTGKKHLSI